MGHLSRAVQGLKFKILLSRSFDRHQPSSLGALGRVTTLQTM